MLLEPDNFLPPIGKKSTDTNNVTARSMGLMDDILQDFNNQSPREKDPRTGKMEKHL